MKERILIPPGLQGRIDGLVRAHARALATTEEDARRFLEIGIITRGVHALEAELRAGVVPPGEVVDDDFGVPAPAKRVRRRR
jgi:hypothetical protein